MDLHEISLQCDIPLYLLRRLVKHKHLRPGQSSNPLAAKLQFILARNRPLSVAHLVALLEDEDESLLDSLGKYMGKAMDQIAKLGSWRDEIASHDVVMDIEGAALKSETPARNLITWIKATLPAQGEVSHAWLAVRIAMGAKPQFRGIILNRINLALLNCRAQPEFAGWFTVRKAKGQAVTFYHRPANLAFDL